MKTFGSLQRIDCSGFFCRGNAQGLVFDYYVNPENGEIARWADKVK